MNLSNFLFCFENVNLFQHDTQKPLAGNGKLYGLWQLAGSVPIHQHQI